MKFPQAREGGIVKLIIIIVIALLILSYYGFNLRATVESPTTQSNFSYAWSGVANIWNTYLAKPAAYLWNIFVNDIWSPSLNDINRINDNQLPSSEQNPPVNLPNAPNTN